MFQNSHPNHALLGKYPLLLNTIVAAPGLLPMVPQGLLVRLLGVPRTVLRATPIIAAPQVVS